MLVLVELYDRMNYDMLVEIQVKRLGRTQHLTIPRFEHKPAAVGVAKKFMILCYLNTDNAQIATGVIKMVLPV